jgi:hypothetical protein
MKALRGRGEHARSSAEWWGRQTRRAISAGLLALVAGALLLLAGALGAAPAAAQGQSAHVRLGPPGQGTPPTDTPTSTATPTTGPAPSITLVSPSSARGPAGASVTVSGNNFSGSSAQLFATTHADCSGSQTDLTAPGLTQGGFSSVTFFWPATLSAGKYYICGPGMSGGAPSYQELTQSPPSLSLSVPQAAINDHIVLTGSNFVGLPPGASVQLHAQSQSGTLLALPSSGVVNSNGSFTVPWTVNVTAPDVYTILATSPQEGSAPPVLQASALLQVTAQATVTPSPTVSPTAAPGTGGNSTSTNSSGGAGGLLLLVGAIIFAVLVILGVTAFILLRGGKQGPQGQPGYEEIGAPYRPGGVSGPGFGVSGQYSRSGVRDPMDPYQGAPVGAVSQWDTTEAGPDANWQPRPMSGRTSLGGQGYPDYAPTEQQGWPQGGGGYPPADPWGNTQGGYGPPPGGGQRGHGGSPQGPAPYGDNTGATQGGRGPGYPPQQGYPSQQGYPPQQPGYSGRPSGSGGPRRTPGQPGQGGSPSGPRQGQRPAPEDEQFGPWPDLGGGKNDQW